MKAMTVIPGAIDQARSGVPAVQLPIIAASTSGAVFA